MQEMYKNIQKSSKETRHWSLGASGVLAISILIVVVITILWALRYEQNYREYVSYFSSSVTHAESHHTLRARVQEDLVWVRGANTKKLYSHILVSGKGRPGSTPEGDPDISMAFGDGGFMKLWKTEGKFQTYVLYQHEDGYSYGYYSSQVSVDTIGVNYLSLSENVAWNGELNIP